MAEPLPKELLDSAVEPSEVAQQTFELERRGFDQAQVRSFLIAVAESLRDAQSREAEMRTRLGRAIRRAEEAEAAVRGGVSSDPGELTRQLGDEVATVLDAARAAGQQRITAAEKSAEQLLTNAKVEASELRQAAESIMDERRSEADASAAEILNDCEAEADQIREKARADSDVMRKDAADDVVRARNECESLIREAEAVRVQILEDMERRRRQSRAQVERLRVGRDRLLRSYDIVRRTLDESTGELKSSLREAKVLGDTAARKVAAEPLASPAELEDELAAKRLLSSRSTGTPETEEQAPATPKAELPKVDLRQASSSTGSPPQRSGQSRGQKKSGTPKAESAAPTAGNQNEVAQRAKAAPVRPFTEVVAPTPRRPADLPKPPAVAPTIKVESATAMPATDTAADKPVADESDAPSSRTDIAGTPGDPIDADTEVVAEVEAEELDLTGLPEGELDVVEPNDEVEQVVALKAEVDAGTTAEPTSPTLVEQVDPVVETTAPAAADEPETVEPDAGQPEVAQADTQSSGLFDALREQKKPAAPNEAAKKPAAKTKTRAAKISTNKPAATKTSTKTNSTKKTSAKKTSTKKTGTNAPKQRKGASAATATKAAPGTPQSAKTAKRAAEMAKQRDAIVAEVSIDIEKRLKRGLADEQNDVLAGIRSAGKPRRGRKAATLISMVGETDDHLSRYVVAISEVAASAYAAGAALIDGHVAVAEMPAGAVEELVATQVVVPQRLHLIELDQLEVEEPAAHLDAIRSFYRSRKNSALGAVAESLGSLLVTAGACEALPPETSLPWLTAPTDG